MGIDHAGAYRSSDKGRVLRALLVPGAPAPGGGRRGPDAGTRGRRHHGVFLSSNDAVTPVACPGDAMPGGGTMASAGITDATYSLNHEGQVGFSAVLNTDVNGDGIADSGVYVSSGRSKADADRRQGRPPARHTDRVRT